jgi:superfamily I DNA/RNA helicase
VNYIQYKLINLFINLGIKIVLVGDDDQCIYQFRGSSNRYIINFSTEHPNTKTFNLNTNYRSTDVIVKFANSIISHNKNRIEKNIQNAPNHQGSINDIKICEFKEFDDEIKFATEQIELYKNAGIDYNQIAVLYRTNKTNIKIIKKLKEAGIPFISNNTTTIYEQNEIMIMYIIFQYINETHSFDFFYNKLIVSVDDKKEFNEFLTQICDGKSIENFNEKTFIINILSKINPQLDNEELEATFNYINSFRNELINLKYKRINIQEVY